MLLLRGEMRMLLWIDDTQSIDSYTYYADTSGKYEVNFTVDQNCNCEVGNIIKRGYVNFIVDSISMRKGFKQVSASVYLDMLKSKVINYSNVSKITVEQLLNDIECVQIENKDDQDVQTLLKKELNPILDLGAQIETAYYFFLAFCNIKNVGIRYTQVNQDTIILRLRDLHVKAETVDIFAHANSNIISLETKIDNYRRYNTVVVYGDGIYTSKSNAKKGEAERIKVIKDERFSVQESLDKYAELLLMDYTTPFSEINLKMVGDDNYTILDRVQILDTRCSADIHYITSISKENDTVTKLTLQNRRLNLADVFSNYQEQQKQIIYQHETFKKNSLDKFQTVDNTINQTKNDFNSNLQNTKQDFNNNLQSTKNELNNSLQTVSNTIVRETNWLNGKIEKTEKEFSQKLTRTSEEMSSKYKEIETITRDNINEARREFNSEISQTARNIQFKVSQVEQNTNGNRTELENFKRETWTKLEVQSNKISSVAYDCNQVDGKIKKLQSEYTQKADSFEWRIRDLDRKSNDVSVTINSWGLSIRGGNLYVSRGLYAGYISASTVSANEFRKR